MDSSTIALIRLFILLVGASAVVSLVARRFALPYTVGLVAFGLLAGALVRPAQVAVTPELVLVVLLPGLIFEAAYQIEFRHLRPTLAAVALLAGPGVFLVALLVALLLGLGTGMRLEIGFVVGAIVAATDPAAVIASFKRLGSPRRLAILIESESLFNDGTGIVLFAIAVDAVTRPVSPLVAIWAFGATAVISAAIGIVAGVLASRLIVQVHDHLIELTISLVLAYGAYLVADAAHQSGIIATAVAGIVLGNYGRSLGLSRRTVEALDTVWEFLAFLLTALVFLLVGLAIPAGDLVNASAPIGWAILAVLLGRAIIVYVLVGGTRRLLLAQPLVALPDRWLHVVFWSGLRGAVSVALALALPVDFPQRALVQQITFGVVLLTLVVQATTADLLLRRLGLSGPPEIAAGRREPG